MAKRRWDAALSSRLRSIQREFNQILVHHLQTAEANFLKSAVAGSVPPDIHAPVDGRGGIRTGVAL